MAEQLDARDRAALVQRLQATLPPEGSIRVTREVLLAELEHLRAAGAFEGVESLRNKYAEPLLELDDDDLRASIREFSTEWEQDLDDLFDDD
ncbi:MAG: hypothetical protein AB1435_03605 [Chloroflexota bacterium]